MTKQQFMKCCYEMYQLDWMKTHGYGIKDIFNVFREYFVESAIDGNLDSDMNIACDEAEEYFFEQGFKGEIFVCADEFFNAEFLDKEYMKYLLPSEIYAQYLAYKF